MIELIKVCNDNLCHYQQYQESFESDLKQYQSRIYPSTDTQHLVWYHIKSNENYIGAVWLEKVNKNDSATLGIFISDKKFRNKGIGEKAIKEIIKNDSKHLLINRIVLRVREENIRAINCYKKVGFKETCRYKKDNLNVIEMVYEI